MSQQIENNRTAATDAALGYRGAPRAPTKRGKYPEISASSIVFGIILGALMNATTAGRQVVEQGIADSLTIGGTALPTLLGAKAPIASPTFTGTATTPKLVITGAGSTGDISAMSVDGAALSTALAAKAPTASPTFTGTTTIPVLALSGTTSTGEIRGMTVNGVTLSNAFAAKAPTASPVFTGVVAANAVPAVDLTYAGTPNPNTIRYASGNAVSFCPALSCINGPTNGPVTSSYFDHQRASLLISAQTQLDGQAEEQTLATITTIGTGLQKAWAANTAFALNDNVSFGNATYRATKAGTTGATNPLPSSRPTSLPATYNDGSVTWTWINDQRINGKLGHYNEVNAITGAGTTWAGVDNLQLNSGVIPSFNVTREVDLTNNSGTDCVINVANCYGLSIFLQGSNYSTAFLDMSSANTNNYAALYGILLGGSKSIRDHDISIQSSGAVGVDIGSFGGANHSVASIRDRSTSPSSIDIGGSHTTGIDTNAMTGTYSMLTKAGQKLCFNGTDNCLRYAGGWQFSKGSTDIATISDAGTLTAAGTLSGGNISTGGNISANGSLSGASLSVNGLSVGVGTWLTYAPAVTYGNGATALSGASATGSYQAVGKTIHFRVRITTGATGGSDSLNVQLPTSSKGGAALLAKEQAQTFAFYGAAIQPSDNKVKIFNLTSLAYPVTAANMVFDVSGTYEAP